MSSNSTVPPTCEAVMKKAGVELRATDISVWRKGKLILDRVSFEARPGTLTAIIGPNGAGKTTLMQTLCGVRPDCGHVFIDGSDLYEEPEHWLRQIGYVPVHSVLHGQLGFQEALVYVGRLRLPSMPIDYVKNRVDELLTQAHYAQDDDRRRRAIRDLSTGERKLANILSELITKPPLLLLDEPTSNLDPHAERNVMELLREYAHGSGATVIVITHTLNTLDACDQVVFIENSRLGAAGPWKRVLTDLEKTLDRSSVGASPFDRWADVFQRYETTKRDRTTRPGRTSVVRRPQAGRSRPSPGMPWWHQLRCLLSRYMRVRLADKGSLVGTLLVGVSGLLFFVLPGGAFVEPVEGDVGVALLEARQSIGVVSIVVALIGLITSYAEISKEFHIYCHERLKGLSPSAYLVSKWIWLVVAVGVLAPILLIGFTVLWYAQPLPGFPAPSIGADVGTLEWLLRFQIVGLLTTQVSWMVLTTLILTCTASITLGLLISAVVGESDRGYIYLIFVATVLVLFSGLVRNEQLDRLVDALSFLSTSRWSFEGFASSIGMYCWGNAWRFEEYCSTGHIASIWLALTAYTLAAACFTVLVLRLRDPWYSRRANLRWLFASERRQIALLSAMLALLLSYTLFLRQRSYEYHILSYFGRQGYGGSNRSEYAKIDQADRPNWLQYWNGVLSQSWCECEDR
ncbi:MAG: ATP-binding cassette domain-containing protein [Anaerolineae bacterium]|nr:ATP-binding cassette domain-containing protein [Anaerolineae bacterium]